MPKYLARATLKRTFEMEIDADDEDIARDECEADPNMFEEFGEERTDFEEWFFDLEEM